MLWCNYLMLIYYLGEDFDKQQKNLQTLKTVFIHSLVNVVNDLYLLRKLF